MLVVLALVWATKTCLVSMTIRDSPRLLLSSNGITRPPLFWKKKTNTTKKWAANDHGRNQMRFGFGTFFNAPLAVDLAIVICGADGDAGRERKVKA